MNTRMSLRRGGDLVIASLAAMALYFLLIGLGWLALAMVLAALGLAVALPRRRTPPHDNHPRDGTATGGTPR
jgi:hypothetical protein